MIEDVLSEFQEAVDDANNQNIFYYASLSDYRTRDMEGASSEELQKIKENILHDKSELIKKIKNAEVIARDLKLEAPEVSSKVDEILKEIPPIPNEDDLKNLSHDSLSDADIFLSSDEDDDLDESLNESKVYQMNQFEQIIEMMKDLKEKESQIRYLEKEKEKGKKEMFEMRERGENVKSSQEDQKVFYQAINEVKKEYKQQMNEIKGKIQNILPRTESELRENLMKVLNQIENDKIAEGSPPPQQQRHSRLPRLSSKLPLPTSKPVIPITSNDPRVVSEIDRHKNKILRATSIKHFGTLQNMQKAEQISKMPRLIPRSVVQERNKQHSAVLKTAHSIGNVKKVGIRPKFQAPRKKL